MHTPIEVVVIRDLALRPRPGPPPSPPRPSAEQTRELLAMVEAVHCDVRQQIPAGPRRPGQGGRANVGLLAERNRHRPQEAQPPPRQVERPRLLFSQREGKEIWYEAAEGRVRYERHDDGRFSLTVTARGSGVAVTLTVPLCDERESSA